MLMIVQSSEKACELTLFDCKTKNPCFPVKCTDNDYYPGLRKNWYVQCTTDVCKERRCKRGVQYFNDNEQGCIGRIINQINRQSTF